MRTFMRLAVALALFAVAALDPMPALAEETGLWASASAEKKIGQNIDGSVSAEFRTIGNRIDRLGLGVSADRRIFRTSDKFFTLKAGLGYKFTGNQNPSKTVWKNPDRYNLHNSYWCNRHRVYVQLTGKFEPGRWELSIRERYQYNYDSQASYTMYKHKRLETGTDIITPEKKIKYAEREHIARTQLEVAYNIRKCKFDPFAGFELYNCMNNGMELEKTRLTVGFDWKISNIRTFQWALVFQDRAADGEAAGCAVSFSYKYKL